MRNVGTDTGPPASEQEARATRRDLASPRLLFLVPFSPRRDAPHGGRVVAQLLLHLVKHHDVAVLYLRDSGSPPIDPELAARCDLVEEIELIGSGPIGSQWRHRLRVLSSPLTGVPSAVSPVRDQRFARACVDIARSWKPDIVQIEHDELAYCGPLLEERYSAAVRILTCHEPGLLASQDQARETHGRQRLAHCLDAASWRRFWSWTLPAFDAVVTLTARDREVIDAAVTGPRIVSIRPGVDLPDEPLSATGHGAPSILFVGGYRHPPNADAALRLLRSIMPAARRRIPRLRLLVVGANPGRELLDSATADDTVTGAVPSVTPFQDAATLIVLPIRLGGGVRVKLLEALAAGKAVVASPLTTAGLEVSDGRELVLAETDEEFAESIVTLVGDEAARSRIGHNAREWALCNLTWDSPVREYEQLYRSLSASRAR